MPNITAHRPRGREHIPLYPRGFLALRTLQALLALAVLGLGAFGVATNTTSGNVFILVAALFNLVTTLYHVLSLSESKTLFQLRVPGLPRLYNYWAVLALDAFVLLLWFGAGATLTSEVSIVHALTERFGRRPYGETDAWFAGMAVAAGGAGVEVILHIISLWIHGVRVYRHRAAGLRARPEREPRARWPGRRSVVGAMVVAAAVPAAVGVPTPAVVGEGVELEKEGRRVRFEMDRVGSDQDTGEKV